MTYTYELAVEEIKKRVADAEERIRVRETVSPILNIQLGYNKWLLENAKPLKITSLAEIFDTGFSQRLWDEICVDDQARCYEYSLQAMLKDRRLFAVFGVYNVHGNLFGHAINGITFPDGSVKYFDLVSEMLHKDDVNLIEFISYISFFRGEKLKKVMAEVQFLDQLPFFWYKSYIHSENFTKPL